MDKMTQAVIDIWFSDPKMKQHCATLVDSMPERVNQVIQKEEVTLNINIRIQISPFQGQ